MIIPIRTDSPLRTTPYMNWALIGATVVAYLVQLRLTAGDPSGPAWVLDPHDPSLWHYFTYTFLHGSWLHLIGNMLFLYIFGNNVNDRMGHLGYLAFYLAGGVFAGVAHVLFSDAPVLGASGAVFAVTGAYLVLLPRSHVTVLYALFLIGVVEVPSLWFILAYFAWNGFVAVAPQIVGGSDAVAHMAHVGGAVFGFTVCMALLAVHLLPRDQFDVLALIQRWNRRREYRDMVSRGYNPFDYTGGARRQAHDPRQERIQELRAQIAESISHQRLPDAVRTYLELRAIDPQQVLSRQNQLDVANQLYEQQQFPAATDAYELFVKHYPKAEQFEQVQLILGLLYARYLQRFDRARHYLTKVLDAVHDERQKQLARDELAKVEAALRDQAPMSKSP